MKHKHHKNRHNVESKNIQSNEEIAESALESSNDSNNVDVESMDANANNVEALDSMKAELEKKDLQIKELEEKYIRAYADFENTKKRLEREKYQSLEYANEAILKDLLPILDTLESALDGIKNTSDTKESIQNIQNGIKLTIDKFLSTLGKYSVEVVDSSGEFDPNLHNAIMQVKDESKEDGQISQVLQKGYKYKERVIRPSMVSITKNN